MSHSESDAELTSASESESEQEDVTMQSSTSEESESEGESSSGSSSSSSSSSESDSEDDSASASAAALEAEREKKRQQRRENNLKKKAAKASAAASSSAAPATPTRHASAPAAASASATPVSNSTKPSSLLNKLIKPLKEDFYYHLGLSSALPLRHMFGDVRFVILSGSPVRAEQTAQKLVTSLGVRLPTGCALAPVGKTERYVLFKVGPVISVSHGMGKPSISILLHEVTKLLAAAGSLDKTTFIRVGTSGGVGVDPGSVIVSTGTVNGALEPTFPVIVLGKTIQRPCVISEKLVDEVLSNALPSGNTDFKVIKGLTMATDDFYEGQGRLDGAIADYTMEDKMKFLQVAHEAGVKNIEMESDAIVAFCTRLHIPVAVVCCAILNRLHGDQVTSTPAQLVQFADNAVQVVIRFIQNRLNIAPPKTVDGTGKPLKAGKGEDKAIARAQRDQAKILAGGKSVVAVAGSGADFMQSTLPQPYMGVTKQHKQQKEGKTPVNSHKKKDVNQPKQPHTPAKPTASTAAVSSKKKKNKDNTPAAPTTATAPSTPAPSSKKKKNKQPQTPAAATNAPTTPAQLTATAPVTPIKPAAGNKGQSSSTDQKAAAKVLAALEKKEAKEVAKQAQAAEKAEAKEAKATEKAKDKEAKAAAKAQAASDKKAKKEVTKATPAATPSTPAPVTPAAASDKKEKKEKKDKKPKDKTAAVAAVASITPSKPSTPVANALASLAADGVSSTPAPQLNRREKKKQLDDARAAAEVAAAAKATADAAAMESQRKADLAKFNPDAAAFPKVKRPNKNERMLERQRQIELAKNGGVAVPTNGVATPAASPVKLTPAPINDKKRKHESNGAESAVAVPTPITNGASSEKKAKKPRKEKEAK
jgi:uridine phosphorylase